MKYDNNPSVGGMKSKTDFNATVLCRKSGFNSTMGAMGSRTRSSHSATSKHNRWEGIGSPTEQGGRVRGYNPE